MNKVSTYTLRDNDLILTASLDPMATAKARQYVLKMRDLPDAGKPREKLSEGGPSSLTLQELLAIVLNTGTKKEGVLEMTKRIVREYGNSALLQQTDAVVLAEDLDIPLGKAAQIVAIGEIGRRMFNKNDSGLAVIRTAQDVYDYLTDMRTLPKEQLRGIYLDTHNRVIHDEVISIGTINTNIVHPREVFKPALEYGAAAVVLAHNHPSGVTTASTADIEITKQLIQAGRIMGINLLDHVIITKDGFASVDAHYM